MVKPLLPIQPVESRAIRDRSAGGRDLTETSPRDAAAKSRSKDAKEKPAAPPVREWDRHKLRQSPARERDGRDRRGREEKPTRPRDRREANRRERDRSRRDHRAREKNDKSG